MTSCPLRATSKRDNFTTLNRAVTFADVHTAMHGPERTIELPVPAMSERLPCARSA